MPTDAMMEVGEGGGGRDEKPAKVSGKAWGRIKKLGSKKYPSAIKFIIGNEFSERFCYYGLRSILVLYMVCFLGMERTESISLYHTWTALCYFFPIIGGFVADSFLGKYKTIVLLSFVYAMGCVVLSVTAIPYLTGPPGHADSWGAVLGLLLIAVGTGGIKPCVSAFGGDQFKPDQARQLQTFFSIFYFSVNSGSFLSTIITPILRNEQCPLQQPGNRCPDFPSPNTTTTTSISSSSSNPGWGTMFGGSEYVKGTSEGEGSDMPDCSFFLGFFVPAVLMVLSIILIIVGRYVAKYTLVKPDYKSNLFVLAAKVIRTSVSGALKDRKLPKERRQTAKERIIAAHGRQTYKDLACLLRVLVVFLPLPLFWALFDQQASTWTLQAKSMNGTLGALVIQPDQVQSINPLLILVLIPLFEKGIYPCLNKLKIPMRPLIRMGTGVLFSAVSFLVAAFVELSLVQPTYDPACLDKSLYENSTAGHGEGMECVCEGDCPSMFWQFPQYFIITAGEIMLSITGLEFAYTQAPASMKSLVQAGWLMTVALGNFLVVVVENMSASLHLTPAETLFFYSGLCFGSFLIFLVIAKWYKYREVEVDVVEALGEDEIELGVDEEEEETGASRSEEEKGRRESEERRKKLEASADMDDVPLH